MVTWVYSKEQLQHQLQLLVTIPPTDLHGHEMGEVYTQSRSTDVPSAQGFRYSLKLDNTTATGTLSGTNYHLIEQKIEGQNLQHLLKGTSSAKKLTLSFWVKSNKTGTYIVRFKDVIILEIYLRRIQ